MHQSVDKTENILDSLISCKLLKLLYNISNENNHQYYFFLVNYVKNATLTYENS